MKIVTDASVIVKWFIQEEFSDLALTLRTKFVEGEIELFAPNLLKYEVLNALKYSKLFTIAELEKASIALDNYGIISLPFEGDYSRRVIQIAEKWDLTIYDAAYIGLGEIIDAQIYTADKKLVEKVTEEYGKKIQYIPHVNEKLNT